MRQTRRKRTSPEEEDNDIENKAGQQSKPNILEGDPSELPEEIAQGVWESLKEEFHASIEQLPLSFHRTFSLISEQDKEAQACYAELLPTIRSYIRLRQSLQEVSKGTTPSGGDASDEKPVADSPSKTPSSNRLVSGFTSASEVDRRSSIDTTTHRQYPDTDSNFSPRRISRMRDATVPKSVPFPPRQKPRSTKELLIRISFLLSEILHAIEEKVGLANAAHDSVVRHIKVLDAAIAEHDGPKFAVSVEVDKLQGDGENESNVFKDQMDGKDQLEMLEGDNGPLHRRPRRRTKDRGRSQENRVDILASSSDRPLPQTSTDINEKRYCYCNQVSYGEMVACDGPTCKYEWFHLGCVGLSTLPSRRAKWYCPDCHSSMEQNKKRKGH